MSIPPDLAAEWAVDNALDAAKDDPFAGDDPTDDYLEEVAKQREQDHQDTEHGGEACNCPPVKVPFSDTAPF